MTKKSTIKSRVIAEPLEPRLLFSGTAEMALLSDNYNDVDYFSSLAQNTDLISIYQLDNQLQIVDVLGDADHSASLDAADIQTTGLESDTLFDGEPLLQTKVEPTDFFGEIIFVDESVADYQTLINDIVKNAQGTQIEIVLLDTSRDGVEQISLFLAQYTSVSAIHILSHGTAGEIRLGNAEINQKNVDSYSEDFSSWQGSLAENADILIYGCDLAANDDGLQLIETIANLTQADVAASNNLTGYVERGGDWVLEVQVGEIETPSIFDGATDFTWHGLMLPASATDDTTTVFTGETVGGNVITGAGGPNVFPDTGGSLVVTSVTGSGGAVAIGTNTVVAGDSGTLTISSDGSYTYVSNVTAPVSGSGNSWGSFNLYGYARNDNSYLSSGTINIAKPPGTLVSQDPSNGLGVSDVIPDGGIDNQSGQTESLVVDLNGSFNSATVVFHQLDSAQARYTLYNSSGAKVGSTYYVNSDPSGTVTYNILPSSAFKYIVFDCGSGGTGYSVYSIDAYTGAAPVDDVFSYTVDNADGGPDFANLTFQFANDNTHGPGTIGISTESVVGNTITTTAPPTDPQGVSGTINYQWERSSNGTSGWSPISGANTSSYNLTASDTGNYVRLTATFIDDGGTLESAASASSLQISGSPSVAPVLAAPSLTLSEGDSHIITAGDISATDADGGDGTLIFTVSGVTHGSFQLVSDSTAVLSFTQDQVTNGEIKFVHDDGEDAPTFNVVARDVGGTQSDLGVAQAATITFTNINDVGTVNISGEVRETQQLTANIVDDDGVTTASYQWERWDGATWSNIGVDSVNYTLTLADVGNQVRVTATYIDDDGTGPASEAYTSTTSVVVSPAADFAPDARSDSITVWRNETVSGNVITGTGGVNMTADDQGNGTATVTSISYTNSMGATTTRTSGDFASGGGTASIAADTGTYVFNTDGSFTFTANDNPVQSIDTGPMTSSDNNWVGKFWIFGYHAGDSFRNSGNPNYIDLWANMDLGALYAGVAGLGVQGDGSSSFNLENNGGNTEAVVFDFERPGSGSSAEYASVDVTTAFLGSTDTAKWTAYNSAGLQVGTGTFTGTGGGQAYDYTTQTITASENFRYLAFEVPNSGQSYTIYNMEANVLEGLSYTIQDIDGDTDTSQLYIGYSDDNASGSVSFSGSEVEGQTLTAGAIVDADNVTGSPSYQWQRSADGNTGWVDIGGATNSTYQLVNDDSTQYVRLNTSYTDGNGTNENIYSGSSNQITNIENAPVNTVPGAQTVAEEASLSIAGISVNDLDNNLASTQLSVGNGVLNVSLVGGASISVGANDSDTLTLTGTQTQINAALATLSYTGDTDYVGADTLTVLSTDSTGTPLTDSDTVSITVTNVNDTSSVAISGTQTEDQTLTANITDNDGSSGAISYQWERSANGSSGWSSISGATNVNYTLGDADVGQYVRVSASYTDDRGTAEAPVSSASGQIVNVNDAASVSVTGTATEDQTLTANVTDVDGASGAITYQWQRSADGSTGWANIGGATSVTYVLGDNDVDQYVRVTASYTDDQGTAETPVSSATAQIGNINDAGAISLSGTPTENQSLSSSITDLDGVSGAVSYQWQRSADGSTAWSVIGGANSGTYTLGDADVDQYVRVTASYTDDQGGVENVVSSSSGQISNVNDVGLINISGTTTEDQVLTANVVDVDGASGAVTYQWQRSANGSTGWANISGATSATYTLDDNDVEQYLRVSASYTDDQGTAETPVSASTAQIANINDLSSISFSGTATEDQTLTASVTDIDGSLGAISYQWQRSANGVSGWSAIAGATTVTYALDDNDVDQYVRVTATFTDDRGSAESPISSSSTQIANINDAGSVAFVGTASEDQTLTSTVSDLDGASGAISYQWQSSADGSTGWANIAGATSVAYVLADTDVDKYVRVTASYTDDQGSAESVTSVPSAQISNVNDIGVVNISGTTTEDQTLTANIVDNDGASGVISYQWQRSADGVSAWTSIAGATSGTYVLGDNDAGQYVRVTAAYTDDQGSVETPTSATSAQITNVNDASSVSITGTVTEDQILTANVVDADGSSGAISYQWQRSADGSSAWANISGATNVNYSLDDADVDQYIRVAATFTDDQGSLESSISSASSQVVNVNDNPVAIADAPVTTNEDTPVVIDVIANDTDIDGTIDPTSVAITINPTNGAVSVNTTTGAITYTPNANYFGSDSFTYTVNDDDGATSNPITVSINVTDVNDAPVAVADALVTTSEDTPVTVDVLVNDTDLDGTIDPTTVVITGAPTNGLISVNAITGEVTYTPNANYVGADSFTYTVNDDDGATSNPITVNISVSDVNDAPIAVADALVITNEDTSIAINVISNDTDLDGTIDPTTVTITVDPVNGIISVNPISGSVTYTPSANYFGSDSFTYTVNDDDGATSNPIVVNISVADVNDAPVAVADALVTTSEDTPITVNVLANDTDLDGTIDPTTVSVVMTPDFGTLAVDPVTGAITYTPDANYNGSDSFVYTVNDDDGATSNPITVNIIVFDTNDAPVAVADPIVNAVEDTLIRINVIGNDTDLDGVIDPTSVVVVANPVNGSVAIDAVTGEVIYTPDADYNGLDSFSYQVSDDDGAVSNTITVNIDVAAVNDAPTLVTNISDAVATEDQPFSFTFAVNTFADIDGDTLIYTAQLAGGGALPTWLAFDSATRTFTGTPLVGDVGAIALQVAANDSVASPAIANFNIVINETDDLPSTIGIADITVDEDSNSSSVDLYSTFSDEEDADTTLVYSLVGNTNTGLFSNIAVNQTNGTLQIEYAANQFGSSVVTVQAMDSQNQIVETSFTINVNSVNDIPVVTPASDVAMVLGSQSLSIFDLTQIFYDIEDGNTLIYDVVSNSNTGLVNVVSINPSSGTLTLEYVQQRIGQSTIVVSATDSDGAVVSVKLEVNIRNISIFTPPEIDIVENTDGPDNGQIIVPEPEIDAKPPKQLDDQDPRDRFELELNSDISELDNTISEPVMPFDLLGDDIKDINKYRINKTFLKTTVTDDSYNAEIDSVSDLANLIAIDKGFLNEQDIIDFNDEMVKMKRNMLDVVEEEKLNSAIFTGVTLSITTGVFVWALRAGSFFLTLFSMVPMWKSLDPLPVVSNRRRADELEQQEKDKAEEDKKSSEVGYMFDHSVKNNHGDS